MSGGVPSKELNESSLNISVQPENDSNIQNITPLYLDKELSDILDQLESDINLLDYPNNIPHIISLLQAGANRDTQNRYGKTLSYYLDEKLFNILNGLAIDRSLLDNYVQHISLLLQAGADPNIQNQDRKTLLHYVAEHNDISGIEFLLGKGANPNVQDQSGKTPLHYAAENNHLQVIGLLLKAGADPNMQDRSGKTPSKYATEDECRQAIENKGNSTIPDGSVDESNDCSNSSGDDSQAKPTELSYCNAKKNQDHDLDDSRENEESEVNNSSEKLLFSAGADLKVQDQSIQTTSEYECHQVLKGSSSDYLFLEDSLLAKLEIPLTTDERELTDKFCKEIRGINKKEPKESIEKIVNEYLEKGLRLNLSCSNGNEKGDKKTVTNLIFEEIKDVLDDRVKPHNGTKEYIGDDKASDIVSNLLLEGGKAKEEFFSSGSDTELAQNYRPDYIRNPGEKCGEIENKKLISIIAYESIVNKNNKQTHEYDLKAEIDNGHFCIEYPQDSIIEPAKILNNEKAKELNLKAGILKIGESIVRVERVNGKRNYTDILKGSIEMSFTTEVGEISICLQKDGNKIKVEINEENKAKFNKLKDKSSLGENCRLGGKSVLEAIEDKGFEKNGSVSTETTKDDPSTDLTQVHLQQNREVALGG